MKIIYIEKGRIPTEKAYGYQVCKMCEEFSRIGSKVELWTPARVNNIKEDTFSYYGLDKNFEIKRIRCFDFLKHQKIFGKLSFYLFGLAFFIKLLFKKFEKNTVVYTRIVEIAWLFSLKRNKVIFEAHSWPNSKEKLFKYFLKKVEKIICNSEGTEKKYSEVGFSNTLVAPNGVDLNKFNLKKSVQELRTELKLSANEKIIMYIGHLYKWKGVEVIIETAKLLKDKNDILFVLVGGIRQDIEKYRKIIEENKLDNVLLCGHQKKEVIPKYLKSADVLLLPNISVTQESIQYTSPIKMFEYKASKKPIIASDLPSIRAVLNKNNSFLFKAGDSLELVRAIKKIFENNELSENIAEQASLDVQKFTWEARVKKIINFI